MIIRSAMCLRSSVRPELVEGSLSKGTGEVVGPSTGSLRQAVKKQLLWVSKINDLRYPPKPSTRGQTAPMDCPLFLVGHTLTRQRAGLTSLRANGNGLRANGNGLAETMIKAPGGASSHSRPPRAQ